MFSQTIKQIQTLNPQVTPYSHIIRNSTLHYNNTTFSVSVL